MNLSGKWIGEYSQLSGTIKPEPVTYDSFELEIVDVDGELTGSGKDTTLEGEPFTISGFYDNEVLSFIKKYKRYIFQNEEGVRSVAPDSYRDALRLHLQGICNAK